MRHFNSRTIYGLFATVVVFGITAWLPAVSNSQFAVAEDDGAESNTTSDKPTDGSSPSIEKSAGVVPDPKQTGGEPDSVVQVANLVYAGVKSSHCFSDHFLVEAEKVSAISTSRRFHAVKLAGEELYGYPLVIMTGEGSFKLPDSERENLRRYCERGGMLLASAGCSSNEWDRSFRAEMEIVFPQHPLRTLSADHAVFHTVKDISKIQVKHGAVHPLEGVSIEGRLAVIYSQDGLNDTAHTQGCCCCGGNEIRNAVEVNVNILAYALTH